LCERDNKEWRCCPEQWPLGEKLEGIMGIMTIEENNTFATLCFILGELIKLLEP
jgi:hypothetical protein